MSAVIAEARLREIEALLTEYAANPSPNLDDYYADEAYYQLKQAADLAVDLNKKLVEYLRELVPAYRELTADWNKPFVFIAAKGTDEPLS